MVFNWHKKAYIHEKSATHLCEKSSVSKIGWQFILDL